MKMEYKAYLRERAEYLDIGAAYCEAYRRATHPVLLQDLWESIFNKNMYDSAMITERLRNAGTYGDVRKVLHVLHYFDGGVKDYAVERIHELLESEDLSRTDRRSIRLSLADFKEAYFLPSSAIFQDSTGTRSILNHLMSKMRDRGGWDVGFKGRDFVLFTKDGISVEFTDHWPSPNHGIPRIAYRDSGSIASHVAWIYRLENPISRMILGDCLRLDDMVSDENPSYAFCVSKNFPQDGISLIRSLWDDSLVSNLGGLELLRRLKDGGI